MLTEHACSLMSGVYHYPLMCEPSMQLLGVEDAVAIDASAYALFVA